MSKTGADMARFWDRRAREDALHFVDNRLAYRSGDTERFWADGERDLDAFLAAVDLDLDPAADVLEVGCGVGRLTRVLASRTQSVVAFDVSAEMIARARSYHAALRNVTWVHGDGVSLRQVRDASVDLCVSHVVFQHIPDPSITLGYVAEMARVLRPSGRAVFQVSNDPRIHRPSSHGRAPQRLWRRLRAAAGRAPKGQTDPAWLGSAIDLDELQLTAQGAGMELEVVYGAGTQFCIVRARRSDS